ncbi:MAG: bifunctional riboflavin kinase/FAD synthetase [Deltaproteobacteria bacterium]|nr:bifunctional riboflavin kinase/FAD synthetase [Deltaproteobacteria bacterium]
MSVIYDLKNLKHPLRNPVLTIGNFDGVHKGHLALFDLVKERARQIGGQSALMTFDPHPIKVVKPGNGPRLITLTRQKLKLIEKANIDVVFCIPFTMEFAAISAHDFVREILVRRIGVKEIVVGYDYTFGHDREGDIQFLQKEGQDFGFMVHVVEPIYVGDKLVSSTSIRKLIQEGNLSEARELLGRDYQVCGTVVRGKNRGGRLLGFPTANIELIDELVPKLGVYAVHVIVDHQTYNGVTNIGFNPTFGKGPFSVETHLLNFDGDLLGKQIGIQFIERLRDERPFGSVKDLSLQIREDILEAGKVFGSSGNDLTKPFSSGYRKSS